MKKTITITWEGDDFAVAVEGCSSVFEAVGMLECAKDEISGAAHDLKEEKESAGPSGGGAPCG